MHEQILKIIHRKKHVTNLQFNEKMNISVNNILHEKSMRKTSFFILFKIILPIFFDYFSCYHLLLEQSKCIFSGRKVILVGTLGGGGQ